MLLLSLKIHRIISMLKSWLWCHSTSCTTCRRLRPMNSSLRSWTELRTWVSCVQSTLRHIIALSAKFRDRRFTRSKFSGSALILYLLLCNCATWDFLIVWSTLVCSPLKLGIKSAGPGSESISLWHQLVQSLRQKLLSLVVNLRHSHRTLFHLLINGRTRDIVLIILFFKIAGITQVWVVHLCGLKIGEQGLVIVDWAVAGGHIIHRHPCIHWHPRLWLITVDVP